MKCDICRRWKTQRHSFHCPACARSLLYPIRVQHAKTLLERDNLGRQVESVVTATSIEGSRGVEALQLAESTQHFSHEKTLAEIEETKRRIEQIAAQAKTLKANLDRARQEIAEKKTAVARRQTSAKAASAGLAISRTAQLTDIRKSARRTALQHDKLHAQIVEARVYLCREAAKLAGLTQTRLKSNESGKFIDEYTIGGIPIVDLHDLNKAPPAQVTTSLTHMARLVVLVCDYLSLRLPAEITLPHYDYPLPTVFPPSSSYTGTHVPFPGSTPLSSTHGSPTTSRSLDHHRTAILPRPRPLYLDRNLPQVARDDPAAFGLFVEGVTLFAWDVAWLCTVAGNPAADLSSLGRNLWRLLLEPRLPPHPVPPPSTPMKTTETPPRSQRRLGQLSHGTAHDFLGGANAAPEVRGWGTHTRAVDQVKAGLLSDITGAEWEVLEERDYVGESPAAGGEGKGWMKVRDRSGPNA